MSNCNCIPLSVEAQICDLYKKIQELEQQFPYLKNARGEYADNAVYNYNDWVTFNGSSYLFTSHTAAQGIPPTNTAFWQLIAEKGEPGAPGEPISIDNIESTAGQIEDNKTVTGVIVTDSDGGQYHFNVSAQNGYDGAIHVICGSVLNAQGYWEIRYKSSNLPPNAPNGANTIIALLTQDAIIGSISYKSGDIVQGYINTTPTVGEYFYSTTTLGNIRGTAGKGIQSITLNGTAQVDGYTLSNERVIYTDGTEGSFDVKAANGGKLYEHLCYIQYTSNLSGGYVLTAQVIVYNRSATPFTLQSFWNKLQMDITPLACCATASAGTISALNAQIEKTGDFSDALFRATLLQTNVGTSNPTIVSVINSPLSSPLIDFADLVEEL